MKITDPHGQDWPLEEIYGCVGKGWRGILKRLIVDLEALGWDGELHQVKEKFGGLRFYIGGAERGSRERIDEAEKESYRTCEDCGAPGKLRQRGWWRTLCDEHVKAKEP